MVFRPNNSNLSPSRKKTSYKFLISACLVRLDCKYDGKNNLNPKIQNFFAKGCCLAACPEIIGGLSTPRPPAEIDGGDGLAVLRKKAKVTNAAGRDVTKECMRGTAIIVRLAKKYGIKQAVLKSNSPCCGVGKIYDGTFTGSLIPGNGLLAAALIKSGIKIYSEKKFIIENRI